jgi:hypothetical protein
VFLGTTQGEVPKACGKFQQDRALSGLFILKLHLFAIYQQFFYKVILVNQSNSKLYIVAKQCSSINKEHMITGVCLSVFYRH